MKRIRWFAPIAATLATVASFAFVSPAVAADDRPNIVFAIADDWGWPHAGACGDPVVKTPAFDALARRGVLFRHAYISSPSCTPSRGAILTGQFHWRLGPAANLWSVFPDRLATYPEMLKQAGYEVGVTGKGWGPGRTATPRRELVGRRVGSFQQFLDQRDPKRPFCFWLGSSDPHRPYRLGSGAASGMDLAQVRLPECFPDDPIVRGDVADYYFEVQRFDALVGEAVEALDKADLADNTIVMMTGDHGMPFPRGKGNLYDTGARVPLALRWPAQVSAGRTIDDFVSLTDLAPTFLQAAGVDRPDAMTGRSLIDVVTGDAAGRVDPRRGFVLTGKERHCPAQEAPDMGGYPCRAIRTHDYLLIRNFRPDRWPAGTPAFRKAALPGGWLGDCDNGPTKTFLVAHQNDSDADRRYYDLSFGKRPAVELYDLATDPHQLTNVADDPKFAQIKDELTNRLTEQLRATGDPRVVGDGDQFDRHPYLGGVPRHPDWKPAKK